MIHKKYINKKYIIYFCISVFIIYNIIYNIIYYLDFKEGFGVKSIKKTTSKGSSELVNTGSNVVSNVVNTTPNVIKVTPEMRENISSVNKSITNVKPMGGFLAKKPGKGITQAQNLAENAAIEAQNLAEKLADELAIQNSLQKLIEPISKLKNIIYDTLNFMKQF